MAREAAIHALPLCFRVQVHVFLFESLNDSRHPVEQRQVLDEGICSFPIVVGDRELLAERRIDVVVTHVLLRLLQLLAKPAEVLFHEDLFARRVRFSILCLEGPVLLSIFLCFAREVRRTQL